VKRDRCHHLPFPPKNLGCFAGRLCCLPPYLRITRSTPLSGDTRFLGPRVAVRSHGDNYVSKATINGSISVYIRRSETLLKLSYPTGSPTDFTTLMCVICHTGPAGCFPAVMPDEPYKFSYSFRY
jgi:hypothetical protein